MQRLSGLDASFLYLETPSQVLHVCGLLDPRRLDRPRRLHLREAQGKARRTGRRDPGIPPQTAQSTLEPQPPRVDRGRRLRPRPPRAPHRRAGPRRPRGAGRAVRAHRRAAARPFAAAMAALRHRRPGRRPDRRAAEDAPRERRRRERRQPDHLPGRAGAGRADAGDRGAPQLGDPVAAAPAPHRRRDLRASGRWRSRGCCRTCWSSSRAGSGGRCAARGCRSRSPRRGRR